MSAWRDEVRHDTAHARGRQTAAVHVLIFFGACLLSLSSVTRDIAERGRTVESVIDQYINTVKPAHEKYIQPVRTRLHPTCSDDACATSR